MLFCPPAFSKVLVKALLEEQKLLLPYVHFSNLTSLSGINSVLSELAGQQSGKKTRGYNWKLLENLRSVSEDIGLSR